MMIEYFYIRFDLRYSQLNREKVEYMQFAFQNRKIFFKKSSHFSSTKMRFVIFIKFIRLKNSKNE